MHNLWRSQFYLKSKFFKIVDLVFDKDIVLSRKSWYFTAKYLMEKYKAHTESVILTVFVNILSQKILQISQFIESFPLGFSL